MKRFLPILISAVLLISIFTPVHADGFESVIPELPELFGFGGGNERAVLFDIDSGAILYEKNGSSQARQGSLTTLMTALLLIENTSPDDWDTPLPPLTEVNSRWSSRGRQMGLKENDTPTRRDLLYALMLMGAADAAFVTEMLVSGSESGFVDLMNEKGRELGMNGTHFDNGYGLGSGSHYTCARDLALLTTEAMKQPIIEQAAATRQYYCSAGCPGVLLTNLNTELETEGCIGVRSGSDSEREHCVITAFKMGDARIAAVVLEAASDTSAYALAKRLINAGASIYASEGGLYSFTPTNALFRTKVETALYSAPDLNEIASTVPVGEGLRVSGACDMKPGLRCCVYHNGSFLWANADELEFICFVDDIFIENGVSLSCERQKNEPIELASFISTRHEVESVSISLRLPDGTLKLKKDYSPCTHGVCRLSGTTLAESIMALQLTEGIYTCETEVKVRQSIPGIESAETVKTNTSVLSVGTGGECVSYNCGLGYGAPQGECFLGEFIIPAETPGRPGFIFEEWNTAPDGTGQSFAPGETVPYPSSLTLYPIWSVGDVSWNVIAEAAHEGSLSFAGFAENTGGITSLRLIVNGGEGAAFDKSVSLCVNSTELGGLFDQEPITLEPGEYEVELWGAAGGRAEEKLFGTHLSVGEAAPVETEAPQITPAPTEETGEKKPFLNLAAVPIAVWFIVGAAVVAGLLAAIIIIIKRG